MLISSDINLLISILLQMHFNLFQTSNLSHIIVWLDMAVVGY